MIFKIPSARSPPSPSNGGISKFVTLNGFYSISLTDLKEKKHGIGYGIYESSLLIFEL